MAATIFIKFCRFIVGYIRHHDNMTLLVIPGKIPETKNKYFLFSIRRLRSDQTN